LRFPLGNLSSANFVELIFPPGFFFCYSIASQLNYFDRRVFLDPLSCLVEVFISRIRFYLSQNRNPIIKELSTRNPAMLKIHGQVV